MEENFATGLNELIRYLYGGFLALGLALLVERTSLKSVRSALNSRCYL